MAKFSDMLNDNLNSILKDKQDDKPNDALNGKKQGKRTEQKLAVRKIRVAGVLVLCNNKFIVLQRSASEYYAGWWGLPAGKVERGENPLQAAVRELKEETGLILATEKLEFRKEYVWKRDFMIINFFLFKTTLQEEVPLVLCNDHCAYKWVNAEECAKTPNLLEGFE